MLHSWLESFSCELLEIKLLLQVRIKQRDKPIVPHKILNSEILRTCTAVRGDMWKTQFLVNIFASYSGMRGGLRAYFQKEW